MARKSNGHGPVSFDAKMLTKGRDVSDFVIENKKKAKGDWCRISNKKDDEDKTLVYIYDEIGMWGTTASDFASQIAEITTSKIELHLNSPGGSVWDGLAIYNSLKQHDAEVHVIVDALAASAASFIAQAGDKVTMCRNATMMIHDASAIAWGNAATMRETADMLDEISDNIADIYAYRAGEDAKFWRDLMIEETWYNAKETVAHGLADDMLDADPEPGEDDEDTEDASTNRFDMSVFNYASRAAAPDPATVVNKIKTKNKTEETQVTKPEDKTENKAPTFTMNINGVEESDPAKIQSHITALETAQTTQKSSARNTFVDDLAKDNKISQAQVDNYKTLVATLSDDQYDAWAKLWDTATTLPILGNHGRSGGDGGQGGESKKTIDDQIQLKQDVVDHLKRGGMKQAVLENTAVYKELQALKNSQSN